MNANAYFLGLDLGQAADYSALALLERQGRPSPEAVYHCRHLKRWPLRTSYPDIAADVGGIVHSPELGGGPTPVLAIDATGVGAPVVDLVRREFGMTAKKKLAIIHLDRPMPRQAVTIKPIQITGGNQVTRDGNLTCVPKRELVSVAQVALQTGRLKIAASLAEAATLTNELMNFKVKISLDTAHDSYGAWREGAHDDLVLALALALWVGVNTRSVPPPAVAGRRIAVDVKMI